MAISSNFPSSQSNISQTAMQPSGSHSGNWQYTQFSRAMTTTCSSEDLLPALCLEETELAAASTTAAGNEFPVRIVSELDDDELSGLTEAISRTSEVALELEKYLLTRTATSSESEIISGFAEQLLESMQHGNYSAAFDLSIAEEKTARVQFPPEYVENNIEIRPGHKDGILWLIARERESGESIYVPLSDLQRDLTSVKTGRR